MLREVLAQKQAEILTRWQELVMRTYPEETCQLLREPDRFANPVGHAIRGGLHALWRELCGAMSRGGLEQALEQLVKVRAVQEFSPGQAVGFILLAKDALRAELALEEMSKSELQELLEFESRIDRALLLAFDLYARDRDRIQSIRANEVRARSQKLIERLTGPGKPGSEK